MNNLVTRDITAAFWLNDTGSAKSAGAGIRSKGHVFGVLHKDTPNGSVGVLALEGVFTLPKPTTATVAAWAPHQALGWDDANNGLTEDLSKGVVGFVSPDETGAGPAASDTTCRVRLAGPSQRPRTIAVCRAVTTAEAAAEYCDIDLGVNVVDEEGNRRFAVFARFEIAADGTEYATGLAVTFNPGGSAHTTVRVAGTNLITGHTLHFLAVEVRSDRIDAGALS